MVSGIERITNQSAPGCRIGGASLGEANVPRQKRGSHMSNLTKWNPLREMEEIQNRLMPWFGRVGLRGFGDETMTTSQWAPLVDIAEDEKEYLINVELPEVKKEDVKVTIESGTLTISGERKFEKEEKNKKYHRIERAYGSFVRSFALPEGTDGSKVKAEFRDGILKVHLPKTEETKSKSLEVKVQ
jgi:HSP20 family protein